jgi:hypothetical protein
MNADANCSFNLRIMPPASPSLRSKLGYPYSAQRAHWFAREGKCAKAGERMKPTATRRRRSSFLA